MNLSTEKKIMDLENIVFATGEEEQGKGGVGWIGSLGLIDADYCLWNGLAMKSCCVALGNYVWSLMMEHDNVRKKNVYMYV